MKSAIFFLPACFSNDSLNVFCSKVAFFLERSRLDLEAAFDDSETQTNVISSPLFAVLDGSLYRSLIVSHYKRVKLNFTSVFTGWQLVMFRG
jgi:hypothetical protein